MKLPEIEAKINRSSGVLDLSMCDLKDASFLKKLANSKLATKIVKIDLSDNALSTISEELNFFPEKMHGTVQEVNLSSNRITSLPKCLGAFKNLRKLDCYNNNLTSVDPDVIGRLDKLKWIDISGNKNLDAKYSKMIQSRLSQEEVAQSIRAEAVADFKKLEKARAKKEKNAAKKAEKERLAEKARAKEERRKAWEAEQERKKSQEETTTESVGSEGDDNVETESESSDDDESTPVKTQIQGKKQANILFRFIGAIFRLVWFLVSKTVLYSIYTAASVFLTVFLCYYACKLFPTNPKVPNYEHMLCPVLTTSIEELIYELIVQHAERY